MSTYSTVTATGASGARYEFQVYPLGTDFNELPGLYMFCHPLANGQWRVHYVGQTHNLKNRVGLGLSLHHKIADARRAGATHVGVRAFNGRESDRIATELDIIQGLKPSLNEMGLGDRLYGKRS